MRVLGVNYDTGLVLDGRTTRGAFDRDVVRRELRIIATDLHATAVRVSGSDPDRLVAAGTEALDAGLEVWFAPSPVDLQPDELVAYLGECAQRAESLRTGGREVVLVLGCELSMFCAGFVPGGDWFGRMATMTDPATWADPGRLAEMQRGLDRWRRVQERMVAAARSAFGGRITYAAGMWEDVDWHLFDIVAVDAYRDAGNADTFRDQLVERRKWGKPVAVTEFGCCTYQGAAARGGTGWMIVDRSVHPPVIKGEYGRDEDEQVRYLRELLEVFDDVDVDAAFWFSFAGYELPHRPDDPRYDLDLAAYGLVAVLDQGQGRTYPGLGWEPKRSFTALADAYGRRTPGAVTVVGCE
ncbi:MAG TPA: hypothetical protein VFT31_03295 [Kribbella sp.]|nr:hypothetical protein [Kribbella sp.]